MSKFGVIGAGRMGKAVAHYLAHNANADHVVLIDPDESVKQYAQKLGQSSQRNVSWAQNHESELNDVDVAVATCGYRLYPNILERCIATKTHMVDLGGNRDVVKQQRSFNDAAANAGITVIPDQGLAPGAINILAYNAFLQLESLGSKDASVVMRVGGMPAFEGTIEENPMRYRCTWSADGLINEYVIPGDVIVDGKKRTVPALTGLETLTFPNPYTATRKFEAFVTGGGSSNLPDILEGRAKNVNYKTLRYPGHYSVVKSMEMLELFGGDNRKMLTEQLEKNMKLESNDDIVLARAGARGSTPEGVKVAGTDFVCVQDPDTGFSAMAQTTGYSAGIVAEMIAGGTIEARGVLRGEEHVPGRVFIDLIRKTGIEIGPMGSLG